MVQPHQANAKATSLFWVLIISSLPVTPGESEREFAFQLGSAAIWGKKQKKHRFRVTIKIDMNP